MKRLIALAATAAIAGTFSAPAMAQDAIGPSEVYNTVFVYGDDPCPESEGDVITVCARMDEGERYRIPPNLRQSESQENTAWATKVRSFETVGRFGQQSCSPVGLGGELGCTIQMIEDGYFDRANSSDVRFSQLINEERQARLSEIDAEAAETQARVEELERAYIERLEAERSAPLPGEEEPLPEIVDPNEIPERP